MAEGLNRVLNDRGAIQEVQQQEQQQADVALQQSREAETMGDVLDPVISFEKTDIEFWVQILQLLVLLLILREVRNG